MSGRDEGLPHRNIADRVNSILASRGITLYQASVSSANLFGRSSPYYLPHNLYHDLRRTNFSPSLFQVFALSEISKYQLTDWLRVFGLAIEDIPRLQTSMPSHRTMLIDSSLDDWNGFVPWLQNLRGEGHPGGIVPLSRLLEWGGPQRLGALTPSRSSWLYARVGQQDALAFPALVPGSIVRIIPESHGTIHESESLALIEHHDGFCCCRIRVVGNGRIVIIGTPNQEAEIVFGKLDEINVIGKIDLEIRNLLRPERPSMPGIQAKLWKPLPLDQEQSHFGPLLRRARLRTGMSFRAASAMSRKIADSLGDERYFAAASSLSDYEAVSTPPRHFHKIATLCVIYGLRFENVLQVLGLKIGEPGKDPIPDDLLGRSVPPSKTFNRHPEPSGFLANLIGEMGEIPLFLRHSLRAICGLSKLSLKDVFWLGGSGNVVHPHLAGGLLAAVNRQKKKLDDCSSRLLWQQPLHIILKRDGSYSCGCCSRENNNLIIYTHSGGSRHLEQLPNRDAEVIGKIVAVVRKL